MTASHEDIVALIEALCPTFDVGALADELSSAPRR